MPTTENFVVFVEEPTRYRIEDGLVYCDDRSGKVDFQRVMSVQTFMLTVAGAQEALAKWRVSQIERGPPDAPIPIGRKRRAR